jgi:hypothetical protein
LSASSNRPAIERIHDLALEQLQPLIWDVENCAHVLDL